MEPFSFGSLVLGPKTKNFSIILGVGRRCITWLTAIEHYSSHRFEVQPLSVSRHMRTHNVFSHRFLYFCRNSKRFFHLDLDFPPNYFAMLSTLSSLRFLRSLLWGNLFIIITEIVPVFFAILAACSYSVKEMENYLNNYKIEFFLYSQLVISSDYLILYSIF